MAKYSSKEIDKINKSDKKRFKVSGCRILSDEEMTNLEDSISLLDSSDVKIIEDAKKGNYSNFNSASPLVRNYVGTLALNKCIKETGLSQSELSLDNEKVKKYIQEHSVDAGFRIGLSALKQSFPDNAKFKELNEYANEYLLAKTLGAPTKESVETLKTALGAEKANSEITKNAAKQVVFAKTLFLAQLGKYTLTEGEKSSDYVGSIAETFAHGGRTNFILPHNDVNNEVLAAFEGGDIGKTAELKSRIAATHSASQREVNEDLSIAKESKEEKLKKTQLGKLFSNQYGMNVAIGGIGEIGPNQKPILADGSSGHMYICKKKGNQNTCALLMVGVESSASYVRNPLGHLHTFLAKPAKQSAFYDNKFGPGDKIGGKNVDLSGIEPEKLAYLLKEFEKRYVDLQKEDSIKLNEVNEMLTGKRLSEDKLAYLMCDVLGMQKDFVNEMISDARKGLDAKIQRETDKLSKQVKDVLGKGLDSQELTNSVKVMQKAQDGKWVLANLFSQNDTQAQRFSKMIQSSQKGEQLYFVSNTKFNPTKINFNNKIMSLGEGVEKSNLATPKEPNGLKRALHSISRGLLFSSEIKQYESSKEELEKQAVINSFIDEHKAVVEQARREDRSNVDQSDFRKELASIFERNKNMEKSSRVRESVSKAKDSPQFK